jgi:hypothetical protein
MQKLVETFLLTQPDWVSAQAIAARFCLDERSLRTSGKQPGLLSKVAVFSDSICATPRRRSAATGSSVKSSAVSAA